MSLILLVKSLLHNVFHESLVQYSACSYSSSRLIDHILTNSREKISQSGTMDIGISDHQFIIHYHLIMIYLTRKLNRMKSNTLK